jgi:hypothetical protein
MTEPATSWPVPDREVTVGGRTRPLEVVVVSGLYAVAALWLAFELRETVPFYADVVGEMFTGSDSLGFLFAWIGLVVTSLFWYVAFAFAFVAVKVFQVDPLGRGLSAVVTVLMTAVALTGRPPWSFWLVLLVSVLGTASLYLSPWTRRAFASSPRRRGRPEPVVVSESVAVSCYSVLGLIAVLLLPGLRFLGELGTRFVLFEALILSACVCVWVGRSRMHSSVESTRRTGRLLLTVTSGLVLAGYLLAANGEGVAFGFALFGVSVAPLWFAGTARPYFGDPPLQPGAPPSA